LIESLYYLSEEFADRSSNGLYRPLFPASVFFDLFGLWCFSTLKFDLTDEVHAVLVQSFMRMIGNWFITDRWRNVLLSAILKLISHRMFLMATVVNAHHVIRRFPTDALIDPIMSAVKLFDFRECRTATFWKAFTILIVELSELRQIDPSLLRKLIECSSNSGSKLDLFYILLKQNPLEFAIALQREIARLPTREASAGLFKTLSTLCLLIAASQPFQHLPNVLDLICSFFPIAGFPRRDPELTSAILILAAAIIKWSNEIFSGPFAQAFLDFLRQLHGLGEDISSIVQLLHGRAFPRGRHSLANHKPIATFTTGDGIPSLITVSGDHINSFVLEVRDRRGLFVWEITTVTQELRSAPMIPAVELPPPRPLESENVGDDWEGVRGTAADGCIDSQSSHFSEQSHLIARMGAHNLRHKAVDFLIESGLSVWKIDDDTTCVLHRFDAIDDTAALGIPVFHFGIDGEIAERTQLFQRFFSLLGEKTNEVAHVDLGLISFDFHRAAVAETKANIGIVFVECPMRVNTRHRSLPKCDLLFYVCPGDNKLYRIWCQCKNSFFWSHLHQYRIISRDDILRSISLIVFQYVALFNRELLFEKDMEREGFLQNIPRTRIGALDLIEEMS
jgi:hypothetical protein